MPHVPLREMLESREWVGEFAMQAAARAPLVDVRVHYVACPICASLMARQNFGRKSHVIVDVCSRHGVWFDAGELPRVLAFVRSGGLARAGASDGSPSSRNIAHDGAHPLAEPMPFRPFSATGHSEPFDALTQAGRDLLDGVLDGLFGR